MGALASGSRFEPTQIYGGAAKSEIPKLQTLKEALLARNWKPDAVEALGIDEIIAEIEEDSDPPALRSLPMP